MSFLKSALNALLKPADDPRQSTAYTYERQRALLLKVRSLLVDMSAARQRLTRKTAVLEPTITDLEEQARQALLAGREDVARLALQRQQMTAIEHDMIGSQLDEMQQEEQRLLLVEHRLVSQIEAYMARREHLDTRFSAAESQVRLNKAMQKVFQDLADLDLMIETAAARTDQMEARASWLNEMVEDGRVLRTAVPTDALLNDPVTAVDLDTAVAEQLARLKRQVGSPSP